MRAFITFEGIEGSGKTTQIQLLSNHLDQLGVEHVLTREPGGTDIGNQIRKILLNPANRDLTPLAEVLLYQAARAQHLSRVIFPALVEEKVVLCDRFKDATRAYQGSGRNLPEALIEQLNGLDLLALEPDLTLLFDLDPAVALSRAHYRDGNQVAGEGRFEQEELAFHARVREGYLNLAEIYPERFRVIESVGTPEEIHLRVRTLVASVFPPLAAQV